MTIHRPKNSILPAVSHLLIFGFVQAKDYDVSGQVFDSNGDKAGKVTVLLLDNSELEVQSATAKGNGKFKFKKRTVFIHHFSKEVLKSSSKVQACGCCR